jgi:hypothetical protein
MYILTQVSPNYAFNDILRITSIFESLYPETGLNFSNWKVESQMNTAFLDLIAVLTAFVLYFILLIYFYPIANSKEGQKVKHCYCLRSN